MNDEAYVAYTIEQRADELRAKNPKLSDMEAYRIAFRGHQQRSVPIDAPFEVHARAGLHNQLESKSPGLAKRLYQNNPSIYRKEIALKLRSDDKAQKVKTILEPFVKTEDITSVIDQVLAYWPGSDGSGKWRDAVRPELEGGLKPYVPAEDLQNILDELVAMWPTE